MKIGNTKYKIEYVNRIQQSKAKEVVAKIIPPKNLGENGKLLLKRGKTNEELRINLFHEITHGIFDELFKACPKYKRKINQLYHDEIFIQRLAEVLNKTFDIKGTEV